eukprot:m.31764 g.31764  ORF g.31764 m.31764 type:complete len:139 (+) comp9833_c0_seq2:242-658(+)
MAAVRLPSLLLAPRLSLRPANENSLIASLEELHHHNLEALAQRHKRSIVVIGVGKLGGSANHHQHNHVAQYGMDDDDMDDSSSDFLEDDDDEDDMDDSWMLPQPGQVGNVQTAGLGGDAMEDSDSEIMDTSQDWSATL